LIVAVTRPGRQACSGGPAGGAQHGAEQAGEASGR